MSLIFTMHWWKSLFPFLRQEISTTIPAVHDAAGVIRCSQKERRCICKVSKSFTCLQEVYFFFLLSALFDFKMISKWALCNKQSIQLLYASIWSVFQSLISCILCVFMYMPVPVYLMHKLCLRFPWQDQLSGILAAKTPREQRRDTGSG